VVGNIMRANAAPNGIGNVGLGKDHTLFALIDGRGVSYQS
jgi:ribosomal protein L27